MELGKKIYELRKQSGFSQEQLAEMLGVSRQAISKWENGQATPELDKTILLCDLFEVSADWLLGRENHLQTAPKEWHKEFGEKENRSWAQEGMIVATVFCLLGTVLTILLWLEWQRIFSLAIGVVFATLGMMIFTIGQTQEKDERKKIKAKWKFIRTNCWILLFIPMSLVYNAFNTMGRGSTFGWYPIPNLIGNRGGFVTWVLFWVVYLGVNIFISHYANQKMKQ